MKCSFCDADASFGPYEAISACEPCADRVARQAERSLGSIWASVGEHIADVTTTGDVSRDVPNVDEVFEDFKRGVEKQVSVDDAESHLSLAVAYREMQLYEDAVREAAVAFRGASDRKTLAQALGMLLSAPLLRDEGLEALRRRLRLN